jgi:asparagine N-glycosylation enzyme membrane subunit Stt3
MAIMELSTIEYLYGGLIIGSLVVIILIAYFLTEKSYQNYNLSIILLMGFLLAMFLVPTTFIFIILIGFFILLINIVFHTVFPKFFTLEEDKFLIDKIQPVWDQFTIPPESKEAQL